MTVSTSPDGDVLTVIGGGTETAVYTPDAATTGSGLVTVADGGNPTVVEFTGLEPVDIVGMLDAVLDQPGANDVLPVTNGNTTDGGDAIVVTGTTGGVTFEEARFRDNTNVILVTDTVDGDDTVTLNSADNAHGNANLFVATGTGSDRVRVNGGVDFTGGLVDFRTQSIVNVVGNSDVAADEVALEAGTGIGAAGMPINTSLTGTGQIEVETHIGGIFLRNSTALMTVGGVTGGLAGITVLTSGAIVVETDDIDVQEAISTADGTATIAPVTATTPIDLGTDTPGSLGLTAVEVDRVIANLLWIGDGLSGDITSTATISSANVGTLALQTGGAIVDGFAGLNFVVDNIALQAGDGDALGTQVVTLAAFNSTAGDIRVSNTGSDLTLGNVDGLVVVTNDAGSIFVDTVGSLRFEAPVITTAGGSSITLIAADNIVLAAGVTVRSANELNLTADNDVILTTGSLTVGTTTITGDLEPAGPGGIGHAVVGGDLTFDSGESFTVQLDGTTPGTGYDFVSVAGANRTVDPNGAALDVTLGFTPADGDTFVLIDNQNAGSVVSNTFAGLPEGAQIPVAGGATLSVMYQGGDGNDVVLIYNLVAPTVAIGLAGESPTNADAVTFDLTFSEPVTNVDASDFTPVTTESVTTGAVTVGDAGDADGSTWTVTVAGVAGDGTLGLDLTGNDITDVPGRGLVLPPVATAVYLIDNSAPAVTIDTAASQADPATTGPVRFTVTFSEPVTGFDASDVDLSASTATGNLTAAVEAISGQVYTVIVSGVSGAGTVVVAVPAGAAVDSVGNPSAAATGDSVATIAGNQFAVQQFAVATSTDTAVTVYDSVGDPVYSFSPFSPAESPTGVRVAMADVNGDGTPDVIVGTGPGVANEVRVCDGVSRAELFRTTPFEPSFTGGVFVAAGDVNGDGLADVVITADVGGGPRV